MQARPANGAHDASPTACNEEVRHAGHRATHRATASRVLAAAQRARGLSGDCRRSRAFPDTRQLAGGRGWTRFADRRFQARLSEALTEPAVEIPTGARALGPRPG